MGLSQAKWARNLFLVAALLLYVSISAIINVLSQKEINDDKVLRMSISTDIPPYQNASLSIGDRLNDLLDRMTVDETAALLFQDMIIMGQDGALAPAVAHFDMLSNLDLIHQKKMTHFNLLGPIKDARAAARWYNNLQREARKTRLGSRHNLDRSV